MAARKCRGRALSIRWPCRPAYVRAQTATGECQPCSVINPPCGDADGTVPRAFGIKDVAALGDLHVPGLGQLSREFTGVDHQLAPVLATDCSRGIRRANTAVRAAVLGQRKNRGP